MGDMTPVTRDEAVRIMSKAIEHGYNEFEAHLLKLLPAGSMVTQRNAVAGGGKRAEKPKSAQGAPASI